MMTELSLENLKRISTTLNPGHGWDFSAVKDRREPTPWNYADIAKAHLEYANLVLDIGTGGGERFLGFSELIPSGIGIDHSAEMLRSASQNVDLESESRYSFLRMNNQKLAFANQSFDSVLCRHAPFEVTEIMRVLKAKSKFVTQQVDSRNTKNICAIFGCGTYGESPAAPAQSLSKIAELFQEKGCQIIAQEEYDVNYHFLDVESFIYWLKAIPIPQNFDIELHWQQVALIVNEFQTAEGIRTNEHRELLVIETP